MNTTCPSLAMENKDFNLGLDHEMINRILSFALYKTEEPTYVEKRAE